MIASSSAIYVLDAYALLAHFKGESGGIVVRSLFEKAKRGEVRLVASAVNLGETIYKAFREFGEQRAQAVLGEFRTLPIEAVPVEERLAISGALIKAIHSISYADCIAAALAQQLGGILVTGDRDFQQVPDLDVEWLPQK